MKWLRRILLVGMCIPWLAAAAASVPEIALPDVAGQPHPVSEYIGHGRWSIVAVWSVDCVICRREIPELAFFHEDHQHRDAAVLGVSIDGREQRGRVKAFVNDHGLGFPTLIGNRADVARLGAERFRGTPTYLIFSPKGELVAQHVGSLPITEIERMLRTQRP